jgi:hypothetical protein
VQQVTAAGSRVLGAARAEIAAGPAVHDVEVVIGGLDAAQRALPKLDGVLGQSFLRSLPGYVLDYRRRELRLGSPEGNLCGERIRFRQDFERPVVEAGVSGRRQQLVLDSGAPALILFGIEANGRQAAVFTHAGQASATLTTRALSIAGRTRWLLSASIPAAGGGQPPHGLLPTSAFASVYVNNAEQYVVFDPQFHKASCSGSTGRSG